MELFNYCQAVHVPQQRSNEYSGARSSFEHLSSAMP